MGHQNVKHAACAALRFGQERPQCDQSALRRFVGDGGAAVGPLKGGARELQPVAKNDAIDRSRKRLASFKSDAASNPSGLKTGDADLGSRPGLAFSERRGSVPDSDTLNLQCQGTLPRSQAYRLEVSTPETSPD